MAAAKAKWTGRQMDGLMSVRRSIVSTAVVLTPHRCLCVFLFFFSFSFLLFSYALLPLLEDALMDRDMVHRQTAASVVKHMSLGVHGLAREDAMAHLLNYVWPNIFETSPHLINAVMDAIDGLRMALGPTKILQYVLQGLFHPARKVRTVYWRLYNGLYISCQDALVPAYPRLVEDKETRFRRWELEQFL